MARFMKYQNRWREEYRLATTEESLAAPGCTDRKAPARLDANPVRDQRQLI